MTADPITVDGGLLAGYPPWERIWSATAAKPIGVFCVLGQEGMVVGPVAAA